MLDAKRLLTDLIDMGLSKDLTDSFEERMEQNRSDSGRQLQRHGARHQLLALNPPKDGFIVPADIQLACSRFQKYHQQKHPGQKLTWLMGPLQK
jgi:hypothetical protein